MRKTLYNERYLAQTNYWEFRPSQMALRILELLPPMNRSPKVLDIGCGEGGTAVFLARNGYNVTAFDLSDVGVSKTYDNAKLAGVGLNVFQADINDFVPSEDYDVVFSSGTLQYLLPDKRKPFIDSIKQRTLKNGIHVLH